MHSEGGPSRSGAHASARPQSSGGSRPPGGHTCRQLPSSAALSRPSAEVLLRLQGQIWQCQSCWCMARMPPGLSPAESLPAIRRGAAEPARAESDNINDAVACLWCHRWACMPPGAISCRASLGHLHRCGGDMQSWAASTSEHHRQQCCQLQPPSMQKLRATIQGKCLPLPAVNTQNVGMHRRDHCCLQLKYCNTHGT